MVQIKVNIMLSIRKEEIVPLGAITVDMCGAVSSASGERVRMRVKR